MCSLCCRVTYTIDHHIFHFNNQLLVEAGIGITINDIVKAGGLMFVDDFVGLMLKT